MKKCYAFLLLLLFSIPLLNAQVTLYSENFEQGGGSFTLNSTDLGGTATPNFWIINNIYAGGNGSLICLGFPFTYSILPTGNQPVGITNSPNSTYLHTMSIYGQADNIFCSSYAAADGICILNSSNFAKMNTGINTTGHDSVGISFWWNCAGGTNIYGEVLYSTNGGTSWTTMTAPISQYQNQTGWTLQTIYNTAFDNQADLRFAYRFVNNTSNSALDPGFSIDDIEVFGNPSAPNIDTDSLAVLDYCAGDQITVCYTASGSSLVPSNTFYLELSNSTGSFSSPDTLGSQMDTTSGCITGTIPAATPAGSGYRVRVVASDPTATLGGDNGMDISIFQPPTTGPVASAPDTLCQTGSVSLTASNPNGATYRWQSSTDGINFSDIPGGTSANYTDSPVSQTTFYRMIAESGPCTPDTSEVVKVVYSSPPTANFNMQVPQPGLTVSFTNLSMDATSFLWDFGDGMSSGMVSPTHTYDTAGSYVVCVTATNTCGSSTFCDTVTLVCPVPTAFFADSTERLNVFFTDMSGGTGIFQWDWDFGDGNSSGNKNPTYTYLTDGTYEVCLTVTDSCGSDTYCDSITVVKEVGIEEIALQQAFEVYPNPFTDQLQITTSDLKAGHLQLSLVNPLGQTIAQLFEGQVSPGDFRITWSTDPAMSKGIYFLRIELDDLVGYRKVSLK